MAGKAWIIGVVSVNILVLALGVLIAALGIWVLAGDYGIVKLSKVKDNGLYSSTLHEPGLLDSAAVICIVVGGAMILISALTLHGVRKGSKCFMAIGTALIASVVLLDIIIIILTGLVQRRVEDHLYTALQEGVRSYYDSVLTSQYTFSVFFDKAQVLFECCGVNNYNDFKATATKWVESEEFMIPRTCCAMNNRFSYLEENRYDLQVTVCPYNVTSYHQQTCVNPIKNWVMQRAFILLGVSGAMAVMKVTAAVLDVMFLRRLKEDAPYNDL